MTLTLTDKWLIVKDSFGGEMMRLSPSQANMRVVSMGYSFLFIAIFSFLIGLISMGVAAMGVAVAATIGLGGALSGVLFLLGVVLIFSGVSFWRMRNCRQLFLTPDVTQFFLVKPAEVPKLFQMMEMVENWTANKER